MIAATGLMVSGEVSGVRELVRRLPGRFRGDHRTVMVVVGAGLVAASVAGVVAVWLSGGQRTCQSGAGAGWSSALNAVTSSLAQGQCWSMCSRAPRAWKLSRAAT